MNIDECEKFNSVLRRAHNSDVIRAHGETRKADRLPVVAAFHIPIHNHKSPQRNEANKNPSHYNRDAECYFYLC